MRTATLLALCSLLSLAVAGCAGRVMLDGPRRSGELRIDGVGEDWATGLDWVKDLGLSVGARHDGEAVYLALATGDEHLQEAILARGLTIWLDGAGGSGRTLGLRYPTGLDLGDGFGGGPLPGAGRPPAAGAGDAEAALARRDRLAARLAALPAECIILRGKDDGGRLTGFSEVPGLELAAGMDGARLLLELRLPLTAEPSRLLPLVLEGDRLGLGLALGDLPNGGGVREGRAGRGGPPMGGSPGMGRPGRPGMSGGMGGMMGGPRQRGGGPIELEGWVSLRLVP